MGAEYKAGRLDSLIGVKFVTVIGERLLMDSVKLYYFVPQTQSERVNVIFCHSQKLTCNGALQALFYFSLQKLAVCSIRGASLTLFDGF